MFCTELWYLCAGDFLRMLCFMLLSISFLDADGRTLSGLWVTHPVQVNKNRASEVVELSFTTMAKCL